MLYLKQALYTMYTLNTILWILGGIMSNKTNTEKIYRELEKEILNLEYKPGQVITEHEISNKYKISRTPCRDILQKLKMSGLIESIPFKSNYVALLDLDIINQSIYMRMAIETMIVKDTMKNLNEKLIAELDYNLKLQELLLKSDFTTEEFYELDCEFHKIMYRATGNLFIWEQIQKAQVHYHRFRMLDIVAVKNFEAIFQDHKKLLETIKFRKFEELEKIIDTHIYSGIRRLKDKINTEFSDYFIKKTNNTNIKEEK